jgi:hypothetical protein
MMTDMCERCCENPIAYIVTSDLPGWEIRVCDACAQEAKRIGLNVRWLCGLSHTAVLWEEDATDGDT